MKIATKIYLITALAVALIIGDAAIDFARWRTWQAEQSARRQLLATERNAARAASDSFAALSAALRAAPAPGTRAWIELGTVGEKSAALLRHTLEEIKADPDVRSTPPGDPLAAAITVLESAAPTFEREWRNFRALTSTSHEAGARVASHGLLPLIEEDLLGSLRQVQQLLAVTRSRADGQLTAQLDREHDRQLFGSLLLLGLIGACLYAIHHQFLRPLRHIEHEARSVNRGERLHVGFTYTNNDELGAVARAVNDTIDKLRSAAFSREELERQVAARTNELRERKRELQESRAQLQRALDGSQLSTWEWNIADGTFDFNGLCTALLGYAPGEIAPTQEAWETLVHPEDLARANAASRTHLEGGTPRYEVELRFRTKSGEWRWVRSIGRVIAHDEAGRPLHVAGTHADIHGRKTAEQNLQRRDEQLRIALASSGSTLWDADLRTRRVFLDERWALLIGAAPGVTHSSLRDLLTKVPAEERRSVVAALERIERGESNDYMVEHRFRRVDGTLVWVRSRGRCVERDATGRALRVIGIAVDLTAVKASEFAAARQAELYSAVNETALDLLARRGTAAVLQGLVDRAATLLGAPAAEVSLIEGDRVVPRAWSGAIPDGGLKPAGREAVLTWRAIDTREPALAHHYPSLTGAVGAYATAGVRAAAVFPILDEGRAIGVLGLCRFQPDRPFTPDDVQLGRLLAQLSALALRNASIYEDAIREAEAKTSALRESEEKFRDLFDYGPVPMVLVSFPRGLIANVNAAVTAAFGYTREECVGHHVLEAGLWSDAASRERYLHSLGATGRVGDLEVTMRHRDGRLLELLMHSRLVHVAGAAYSLNTFIDVTRLKRTERALREGEQLYRTLVEAVTQGYYVANFRSQFTYCNPALLAMIGYTAEELRGTSCFRLVAPEARAEIIRRYKGWAADSACKTVSCEFPAVKKDGRAFWVEQTTDFVRNEQGLVLEARNMLRDIAERKRAETALRESEERFHAVFEESPVMILLLSFPEGKIIEVNSAAVAGFGTSRAAMLGRTSLDLMAWVDLADRQRYLHLLQTEHHLTGFETRMRRRNGEIFSTLISGSLITIGGQQYTLNSLQDISAQRVAEARLRQTQKMESLGTLAGGIAHDFNNLLTGILGSAELVRLDLPAPHPAQRWLENIASGGARAKRLVQQILTFSRQSEGERGPVDLVRVVEEALRLLGSTLPPMVQIDAQLDRACPAIRGDATQLHQVLMNLCTNAWQSLPPEGGRIGVQLARTVVTAEQVRHNPELPADHAVLLTVTDSGAGMSPDVLPRIFDPFFTTKEAGRGTGLGLAVVHGIVRAHGGAIVVRSTPGAGSTFEIYFPALADAPGACDAPPALPADVPRGHQQRILFVDDDPGPRAALAGMLHYLGYVVTPVGNPAEALLKFAAQPGAFDLLVADYAMPGMTGIELARQVRAVHATLPILIVSGHLEADQRAESSRLGIAAVLSKPPSLPDLARSVARALDSKTPAD